MEKRAHVTTEHLFREVLLAQDSIPYKVLRKKNKNVIRMLKDVNYEIDQLPRDWRGDLYLTDNVAYILDNVEVITDELHEKYIEVEHIFLAIFRFGMGPFRRILSENGLRENLMREYINEYLCNNPRKSSASSKEEDALIEQYAQDLVAMAKTQKLDPVIGRDAEVRCVINILARKQKNNPILIGEPGVGKTAVVEELAQRILAGDVPKSLQQKQLYALDMGALVAGTTYRGEFEDRFKSILDVVKNSNGKIILFIDEMHTVVSAGKGEGGIDAGNLLKPMLARGELSCIGATTLDEYRRYIEKDAALTRRFEPVLVGEPSVDETVSILRGLKSRYETFHNVPITDKALVAATTLSHRYITERLLPDKAIALVDEACAMIRTELDGKPAAIEDMERHIKRLENEVRVIKKDTNKDGSNVDRIRELQAQIEQARADHKEMTIGWEYEEFRRKCVDIFQQKVKCAEANIKEAEAKNDLEKATDIREKHLSVVQKKLANSKNYVATHYFRFDRHQVTDGEIAELVSQKTGIPVSKLMTEERDKLKRLPDMLRAQVIGQEEAVETVASAIIRARAGLKDPNRPIGSFLFLGPTGVGKTELAKALAKALFEDENNMLRFDMSEYMEKHAVSRLIGAPPGYTGYDAGGQLTEAVRRKPYCIVLLDEIEKAHPDVLNILLQAMDDGRITDSHGRTVDFKNTVIIMTSNIGALPIPNGIRDGAITEAAKQQVNAQIQQRFRPEFINRIDDIVLYKPLARQEIAQIADMQINAIRKRLEGRKLHLEVSEAAKGYIADAGYDPQYGARPLKRLLQKELENRIAYKLIDTAPQPDTVYTVDWCARTGLYIA